MNTEDDFWRLLGDYEGLTRDETAALHNGDFSALSGIHERKPLILCELVRVGNALGINRERAELDGRLRTISQIEQDNAALVNEFITKNRQELQALEVASDRLRAMKQAYGHNGTVARRQESFNANV